MEILLLTNGKHIHNLLATTCAFDPIPTFLIDGVVIHYSLEGSNNRTKEEAIVLDYIGQIMLLAVMKVGILFCPIHDSIVFFLHPDLLLQL